MTFRLMIPSLLLLLPLAAAAQQPARPTFQRPTFDRSSHTRGNAATQQQAPSPAPAAQTPATPAVSAAQSPTNPFGQVNVYYATDEEGKNRFGQQVNTANLSGGLGELAANPLFEQLPRKPIPFRRATDWDEIAALQEKTGACILIHFIQTGMSQNTAGVMDSSEKGRTSWFEKKTAIQRRWRNALTHYIQVSVTLPGNRDVQAFAQKIRKEQKNLFYVLKPGDNRPQLVRVFEYDSIHRELKLLEIDACIQNLRNASTPAYATVVK